MATLASKWEDLNPRQKNYFVHFLSKLLEIASKVRNGKCGIKEADLFYHKVRLYIEDDFKAMLNGFVSPTEMLIEYYGISCEYSLDPEYIDEQIKWFNYYADKLNA